LVDRDARRKRNRRHAFVSTAIAGIAVVCLALVALHVLMAENQFRLDRLQDQASTQQARYEKLRLEVAQLEAPARIVGAAEGKLGMVQPGAVIYVPAPTTPAAVRSAPAPTRTRPGGRNARRDGAGPASEALSSRTVTAPAGDADWPMIKQYLSGTP